MDDKKRRQAVGSKLAQAARNFEGRVSGTHAWDPAIADVWPYLIDFLAATVGPDGKSRRGAAITLFAREGTWRACLRDRDLKLTVWGEGDCVRAAIDDLERQLSNTP